MSSYEFKWKDCSGNYGPWRTKKGYFVYRLKDDLLSAHIGITRFEENRIEAFLKDKQGFKFKNKVFGYKKEDDIADKVILAKEWAEEQMMNILQENIQALMNTKDGF